MITRLDHIVLICRDFDKAVSDYTRVFGRSPARLSRDKDFQTALFSCANTALEIMAPCEGSNAAPRIEALLDGKHGKLTSLAFQAENIETAHHVLTRRGLMPSEIFSRTSEDVSAESQALRRSFRCPDNICAGIKTFVLEAEDEPLRAAGSSLDQITSLDHLVINTPNPERSLAHYGARLGLRLALDRTIDAFKTRFLFFRVGGVTLEIIHRLDQSADPNALDKIWGLTWAVDNLQAAHDRLSAAELDVSPVREGRKPGSQVFTLRNGTMDIPTLFIAHKPKTAE